MGNIRSINISTEKGTVKRPVDSIRVIEDLGLEGDAHAGKWHRQVSLLSYEKFEAFKASGAPIEPGAFGENLLVEGFDFKELPVGTIFRSGDVRLEMTQIGNKGHTGSEIYKITGDCIMPREGVFARVLSGGFLKTGDPFELESCPASV